LREKEYTIGVEVLTERQPDLAFPKDHQANRGKKLPYGRVIEQMPLSAAQKSMWVLQKLAPDSIAYNVYRAVDVIDDFNIKAFEHAWHELIKQHASLRTTFVLVDGEPIQRVHDVYDFSLNRHDVSNMNEHNLDDLLCRDALQPFDLENGPLFRISIYEHADSRYTILFNFHHIITDLWSFSVLMGGLGAHYDALTQRTVPKMLPVRMSYTDYVKEQQVLLASAQGRQHEQYWKNVLSGELSMLDVSTDHPRPVNQTFVGKARSTKLSEKVTDYLADLAKKHGSTLPVLLMAAYHTLLYRYTGQHDIVVGSPKAGRSRKTLATVGYFVNTIPIRSKITAHQRFVDFLKNMNNMIMTASAHDTYPFSMMVEKIHPNRDPGRPPLYQTVFSFQKTSKKVEADGMAHIAVGEAGGYLNWGSLRIKTRAVPLRVAPFDLSLLASETSEGLILSMQYNVDLYDEDTIDRMLGHFKVLLSSILDNPYEFLRHLPILSDAERSQILQEWNSTYRQTSARHSVKDHFEYIVDSLPNEIALISDSEEWSYKQLNVKANQLAHFLRRQGVDLETPVGVMMHKSAKLITTIWGILKAGGAFVPLDPTYPQERLLYMQQDSGTKLVLTSTGASDFLKNHAVDVINIESIWELLDQESPENPNVTVHPDSLAYIIYTSGSTGKPKGTLLQNRGIGNLVEVQRRTFDIQPTDRILQYASISFDASVWELVMAHLNGAALVLPSSDALIDPKALLRCMDDKRVSVATLPPSLVAVLPKVELQQLRTIITAGESCRQESVRLWSDSHQFYNAYGPTESTVCASLKDVTGSTVSNPPIGRPLDNFRLYVLDAELEPVPVGVPGELFISSISLARGYLNQPVLTALTFLPDPFNPEAGARMYKTGDQVRFLHNGDIEYLGRIDNQLKIRGLRLELGEIENTLSEYNGVKNAVVIAHKDKQHDIRLAAFYISSTGAEIPEDRLKSFMKKKLPAFMVPFVFVHMDNFPLTQNKKIDRDAFPDPLKYRNSNRLNVVKPKNKMETVVSAAWQKLLDVEDISVHDNFFEIGGHSLMMVNLHAELEKNLEKTFSVVELFQYPTIATQAKFLSSSSTENMATNDVQIRTTRQRDQLFAQRSRMVVERQGERYGRRNSSHSTRPTREPRN
jgi:amino acid adenylation domain-containing protein